MPRRLMRPLQDFISTETLAGAILLLAAATALIWANSPVAGAYTTLWTTKASIGIGDHQLSLDLRHLVNDGLMALFFFVVGLEIKRELLEGELREPRRAALPVIAAIGGMVVPALLYLAITSQTEGAARGWGIPMATDIALALGVVGLMSKYVPATLKLFLLSLAIVDDMGAIMVIAIFYTSGINFTYLLGAFALLGVMFGLRSLHVRASFIYVAIALVIWLAVYESGVHATIAGIMLATAVRTRAVGTPEGIDEARLADVSTIAAAKETVTIARQSFSVLEWTIHRLHPWTSYLVLPLFALANAGLVLDSNALGNALTSPITIGIVVGLVFGKIIGISGAVWIGTKLGAVQLPRGVCWGQLFGVSTVAGVGFTVSLLVSELAFDDLALLAEAKTGVLVASVIAAIAGALLLRTTCRRQAAASLHEINIR